MSNAAAWNCGSTYVVQPGDWLSKIANRCGVSLSQLYAANPNVGYYIYPGQVLNIPGGYGNAGLCPAVADRYPAMVRPILVMARPGMATGIISAAPLPAIIMANTMWSAAAIPCLRLRSIMGSGCHTCNGIITSTTPTGFLSGSSFSRRSQYSCTRLSPHRHKPLCMTPLLIVPWERQEVALG